MSACLVTVASDVREIISRIPLVREKAVRRAEFVSRRTNWSARSSARIINYPHPPFYFLVRKDSARDTRQHNDIGRRDLSIYLLTGRPWHSAADRFNSFVAENTAVQNCTYYKHQTFYIVNTSIRFQIVGTYHYIKIALSLLNVYFDLYFDCTNISLDF